MSAESAETAETPQRTQRLLCLLRFFCAFCALSLLCTPLPETIGRLREVYVFTDYPEMIRDTLSKILEEEILTPQEEKLFRLKFKSLAKISGFPVFHTTFLIGTLADATMREFLGAKQEVVEKDTFAFFRIKRERRKEKAVQLFIFAAKDKEDLNRGLFKYKEEIRYFFEDHLSELLSNLTYSQGENTKVEERLAARYGFSLRVPRRFLLEEKYAGNNFIYLFAHYPDRSIFVYWSDEERTLLPADMITLRDSLTDLYYDGDYVARKWTRYSKTKFLGNPAIKLQGVWQNDKEVIGGPFVAYAFNYEGRFYFIDGTLFIPGKQKLNNLLQLSVILSTFSPLPQPFPRPGA